MEKAKILLHISMIRQRVRKNLAVFLSILVHCLLVLIICLTPNNTKPSIPLGPMTVKPVSEKDIQKQIDKDMQNVSAADDEFKSIEAPDTKLRGKQNQKVPKNIVAAKTDKFKNSKKLGGMNENDPGQGSDEKFGESPKSITKKGKKGDDTKKGEGISANDDFIEGAEIGPRTILNTQEYKYHNFYQRIKDQLVERWRPKVRKEIDKIQRAAKLDKSKELSIGAKITRLEVKMNATGDIISITILKSSGVPEFDRVAEEAFREAAPFAHAPKDLIKNGEFIIRWDFTVIVEQASLVEIKTGRHN